MEIILTKEEKEQIFFAVLCNIEGAHYFELYGLRLQTDPKLYNKFKETQDSHEDVILKILKNGGALKCIDLEEHAKESYTCEITLNDIYERFNLIPTENLLNMINQTDDITDSDIILQTLFYKQLIFS